MSDPKFMSDPESFDEILSAAVNLRSLRLNWVRDYHVDTEQNEHTVFGRIKKAVRSNCLQKICISELSLREKDLKAFLVAHYSTLRMVEMESVTTCKRGSWKGLLCCMVQELSVENLKLSALKIRGPVGMWARQALW